MLLMLMSVELGVGVGVGRVGVVPNPIRRLIYLYLFRYINIFFILYLVYRKLLGDRTGPGDKSRGEKKAKFDKFDKQPHRREFRNPSKPNVTKNRRREPTADSRREDERPKK